LAGQQPALKCAQMNTVKSWQFCIYFAPGHASQPNVPVFFCGHTCARDSYAALARNRNRYGSRSRSTYPHPFQEPELIMPSLGGERMRTQISA